MVGRVQDIAKLERDRFKPVVNMLSQLPQVGLDNSQLLVQRDVWWDASRRHVGDGIVQGTTVKASCKGCQRPGQPHRGQKQGVAVVESTLQPCVVVDQRRQQIWDGRSKRSRIKR
ncbi:hypothetical protein, variant [Aphanomyces astaci]|uniref:Uncharacterized protein n=1 Tax=Aphanomyces astaci TaxID=112090 RepID=W4H6Q2_APHAT|nr:hypothetical protein, variant [Aphanomyces astaci]ETV86984.1 hypothetical protein, variant [Aphanomyces astaci]|eukprot:XP_009823783.1 hypothetical protein, variant [Aphanomyces astaci]